MPSLPVGRKASAQRPEGRSVTSELVPYVESTALAQRQATMHERAISALEQWAHAAIAAHEVAASLVKTSFVPEAFKNKPHEATAAILSGAEVGLSPLASLRSFDIISGTAAPRALTLRAIVQSQGHAVWVKESTATRAVVCGQRRGSNVVETSTWTLDRAKGLGLTNKDNWRKQPAAMLVARGTSEVCRLVAADAILGIGITSEELIDGDNPDVTSPAVASETQPTTRKMSRRKPVEQAIEEANPVDEPITNPQITKLHASFGDLGILDRDQKLAYASKVLDHPIDSSRDLTKAEAMRVIDALEADITAAVPSLNEPEEGA
jgi:hypothetical protein